MTATMIKMPRHAAPTDYNEIGALINLSHSLQDVRQAARLAVLLALDDAGMLERRTLQSIADALGDGINRSTIMRDKRRLPEVRRRRDAALRKLA